MLIISVANQIQLTKLVRHTRNLADSIANKIEQNYEIIIINFNDIKSNIVKR